MQRKSENPSAPYRDAVRHLMREYTANDDTNSDADFKRFLQASYSDYAGNLVDAQITELGGPEARRIGLFGIAVGLFSFGELEMADDILDNVPSSGSIRDLALVLPALLPLPESFDYVVGDPRRDPETIRQFIKQNLHALRWDEAHGGYVLCN